MNPRPPNTARAMTLIEVVASIAVLGVIAAIIMPVIAGATDAYVQAAHTRRIAESAGYALERTVRLLRDTPPAAADPATLGLAAASSSSVRFADGRGIELSGTTLNLRAADGTTSPLCRNVQTFTLDYLAANGTTSTLATPAQTHCFNITLRVEEFELRAAAFPRVRLITP